MRLLNLFLKFGTVTACERDPFPPVTGIGRKPASMQIPAEIFTTEVWRGCEIWRCKLERRARKKWRCVPSG
jgi:hypothetical protein